MGIVPPACKSILKTRSIVVIGAKVFFVLAFSIPSLLPSAVKRKRRLHRGMFCRRTSTLRYDTSMTKNSTN